MSPGYPEDVESEMEILRRRIDWRVDDPTVHIEPVVSLQEFRRMQEVVENIFVDRSILRYITELVRATREHELVEIGSSPRGGLALLKISRALAAIDGRDFVIPDDVKRVAIETLSHRIILNVEYLIEGVKPESVVEDVLKMVEVPKKSEVDKSE
jgi:MoxR-like ATPase